MTNHELARKLLAQPERIVVTLLGADDRDNLAFSTVCGVAVMPSESLGEMEDFLGLDDNEDEISVIKLDRE